MTKNISNHLENPSISLGICTFNRCKSLAITLASIVEQKTSFYEGDEVIVIDNDSKDCTKEIVDSFIDKLPLRYVFEKKQGLSAARNRLISESKGEVVIFIDDDITLSREFVDEYRQAFQSYTDTGFFGGKLYVDWCGPPPGWYRDASLPLINGFIGHYDLGNDDNEYAKEDLLPYGANFALRVSVIEKVGSFDESLGVKGTQLDRGEETDYFMRAIEKGVKGCYVANARAGHRFDQERINLRHLYSYGKAKGRFNMNDDQYINFTATHALKTGWVTFFFSQTIYCLRASLQLLKGRRDRFYQSVINLGIRRSLYLQAKNAD